MSQLRYGQQVRIAKSLKITPQHMNDILKGRRRPSPDLAARLEQETGIDRRAWLYPDEFRNPLVKSDAVPPQPQSSRA